MYHLMKRIRFGPNFTIFLLFFGVAALEAFESRSWVKAAFWLAIGTVFLAADSRLPTTTNAQQSIVRFREEI